MTIIPSDPARYPLNREDVLAVLAGLNIAHTTHTHKAVFTVEESASIKANLPGGHTKNLFLKDKSGQFVLICAISDTDIPVNKMHRHLDCKRLSFGKADALYETLGVKPGSVTVLSIINDRENAVKLVLDKALWDYDIVNFHPMENTATTALSPDDVKAYAEAAGHTPMIVDFKGLQAAADAPS